MFEKNNWLNLVLGLLGFYTVFSVMEFIMGRYGTKVLAVTPATNHITVNYYWLISFVVALIISLVLVIIFCKPRAPLFVFIAILLGGTLSMFYTLSDPIIKLDKYFRSYGIAAMQYLFPHLVVVIGALIALYVAYLSNKMSNN